MLLPDWLADFNRTSAMDAIAFTRQLEAMYSRLEDLYQKFSTTSGEQADFLPDALKELGTAAEKLQMAASILQTQRQTLSSMQESLVVEQQRYQELLELLQEACIVTDEAGMIQGVNRAAANLLNLQPSTLTGKSLAHFISAKNYQSIQAELARFQGDSWLREWRVQVKPWQQPSLEAIALIKASSNHPQCLNLYWLIRDVGLETVTPEGESSSFATELGSQSHFYCKGETITLSPQLIWRVQHGVVKLTTLANNGDEILLGLVSPDSVFGSCFTALSVYQAVAVIDTQLEALPFDKISTTPHLSHSLLPQVGQRLRQTELLLAICGQRRVSDRLHSLLQLLRQEIGESTSEGIRLNVRLTHEELASACGTTRVTITRLLSKLQQQQKITVDEDYHLILRS